jgi:hypothetical protein
MLLIWARLYCIICISQSCFLSMSSEALFDSMVERVNVGIYQANGIVLPHLAYTNTWDILGQYLVVRATLFYNYAPKGSPVW